MRMMDKSVECGVECGVVIYCSTVGLCFSIAPRPISNASRAPFAGSQQKTEHYVMLIMIIQHLTHK